MHGAVYPQGWSGLEAMHVQSRRSHLQSLQLLSEIQEYLTLVSDSGTSYQYEVQEWDI